MKWYKLKNKRPEDGELVVFRYKNPYCPALGVRKGYGHSDKGTIRSMCIGDESWILEWTKRISK